MIKLPKKIILGSKSPRRSQLLSDMDLEFEIFTFDVDESFPKETPLSQIAEYISIKKCNEIFSKIDQDAILITADSVVVCDDELFEKPKDFNDAVRILDVLSGKKHTVYTGVSIKSKEKTVHFTDATEVTLASLETEEIKYYIEKYSPFDKAGSYGIQDWIGFCKVTKIEGSYSNIMGLPTHAVYEHLQKFI